MSCKILVIGDMHFSVRSASILEELKIKIISTIIDKKPDHVIFLGDTHDRFRQIDSVRSREVTEFLYKVSTMVPYTLLIGNHDIPNKTYFFCEDHAFTALKYYWKNTTIVDKCVEFDIKGFKFRAIAYCPNGRLMEGLMSLDETGDDNLKKCTAIFCHQEIKGCNINGFNSTEGDDWKDDYPLLVCGHIHKYHLPKKNVLYVGTPYQDNFGEDIDKSISLLSFNNDSYTEERIFLDLPKKIKLHLNCKDFNKWKPDHKTLYSITITGSWKECSALRHCHKSQKMRTDGNKIQFITTSILEINEKNNETAEVTSLKFMLAESIKSKKYLEIIYNRVFH